MAARAGVRFRSRLSVAAGITRRREIWMTSSRPSGPLIAIVDSGPLYAVVDADDDDHGRCLEVLQRTDLELVVPALVVAEVTYLVGRRLGALAEAAFLRGLEAFEVEADGGLRALWREHAAPEAHCVATDDRGHVLVCDPRGGRLLLFEDAAGPDR